MLFETVTDWEGQLSQNISEHKFNELPLPSFPLAPDGRWAAASAMQKGIRRGDERLALTAAHALYKLNPNQLWNRLKVICIEDVFFGNTDIIGETLWVSGKQKWRENVGGDLKVISYLVTELTRVTKSRATDELIIICNKHPDYKQVCADYSTLENNALEDILLNPKNSLVHRAIAAIYLAGTSKIGLIQFKPRKGHLDNLIKAYEKMNLPDQMLEVIGMGIRKGNALAILVGLLWDNYQRNEQHRIVDEALEFSGSHDSWWPLCSYDMHVRTGKRAYALLSAGNEEIRSSLLKNNVPVQNHVDAIGLCVFGIEGTLLNNRVWYKTGSQLTDIAHHAYFGEQFFHLIKEFPAIIRQNIPALNEARVHVLNNEKAQNRTSA